MADVKDILGVAREKEQAPSLEDIISPRKKKLKTQTIKVKKPDGVSREVFALTGGSSPNLPSGIPPLVPNMAIPAAGFKEKRKLNKAVTKWMWRPFRNSARKDGAVFCHWARAEEEVDDYQFSRFNKRVTVFEYTPEQYAKYFNNDPNWTKEETDELWDLCKMFDLRFIVIADRFSGNKSLEDIKERYYTISIKLLELNTVTDEDTSKHPLMKFPYNKEHELARKKQYEKLYHRTKEQIEEEKKLIVEYKRIEANIKKHQKDKKKGTKMSTEDKKRKKKLKGVEESFEEDAHMEEMEDVEASPAIKPVRKEKAIGPFPRSNIILTPLTVSNKVSKRVDDILLELGVGLRPMPTKAVCNAFNELRQDIVTLLDLQKAVAQKEYQLQIVKDQKQILFKGNRKEKRLKKKSNDTDLLGSPLPDVFGEPFKKRPHSGSLEKAEKKKKKKKKEKEEKDL